MSPRPIIRSDRRMLIAIAAMVVVWAVVMLQRNEIRARWWEYRLIRAESLEERARHLALLVGLGDRAVPVAERLLRHKDPALRSYGLVICQQVSNERAGRLLGEAASDPAADIREGAVRGLGARGDVDALAGIVRRSDRVAACAAAEALASIGSSRAIDTLIAQVLGHPLTAVRVQAIECLGGLQARAAVGALTGCLGDDTVFEGYTAAERSAAGAIQATHPEAAVDWPGPRTVGDFAAAALERITGQAGPDRQDPQPVG